MRKMIALLALLLFAHAFAGCNGSASHYLPAIVGNDGVLVNVSLQLENGTGDIFFSLYPSLGLSTQDSAKEAIEYAFWSVGANKSECDVLLKAHLSDHIAGFLDGPSGGAAFTLMGIAALEGKDVRKDAMITGTITRSGDIGPVGGVYEKARIAQKEGLAYFLTPRQSLYERAVLRLLQENGTMQVFEVENISEAEKFMIDGGDINTEVKPPVVVGINSSLPIYENAPQEFAGLAQGMMALLNGSAQKIDPEVARSERLDGFFSQVLDNENALLRRGYPFTAANDAFTLYLDAETIANINDLDAKGREAEAEECISGVQVPQMTDANIEWVAGQEVRKGWAQKKLGELEGQDATLNEDAYVEYHDAMYADAWCRIAGMLGNLSPKSGTAADEGALANLSWQYIEAAMGMKPQSDDVNWHLENAEKLYEDGKYAGAIIDSVFAIETENGSVQYDKDKQAADAELAGLFQESRSSLWGRVYASHAAFVMWQGDNATAYSLFRFARGSTGREFWRMPSLPRLPGMRTIGKRTPMPQCWWRRS